MRAPISRMRLVQTVFLSMAYPGSCGKTKGGMASAGNDPPYRPSVLKPESLKAPRYPIGGYDTRTALSKSADPPIGFSPAVLFA